MEEMINIAKILENAPKRLKLYSPICGECELRCVSSQLITVVDCEDGMYNFGIYGEKNVNGECLLFPSKDHRTWDNNWQEVLFKKGDIIVSIDKVPILYYEDKGSEYSVYNKYGERLGKTLTYLSNCRYATPKERDKFFKELNDNGYYWNENTKQIDKTERPNSEHNTNIDNLLKNNTFYHIPEETEVEVTPDGCYKCVLKTEKKNPKFRIGDHIVGDDETIYKIMDVHGTLYTLYDYSNQNKFKQTIKKIDENHSLVTDQELIDAGIKNQQHKFKAGDVIRNKETGIVCKINYLAKNWYIFYKNKNQSGLKYENEDKWELVTEHKSESHYATPHRVFFNWIFDRLVNVHGENPNVDYMQSLKERIDDLFPETEETNTTSKPTEEKSFTIDDFKPFDKVLVRNYDVNTWSMEFFESYRFNHYYCMTDNYKQCIPYNEETKHLLCEKEDCPKKYKTWEE